MKPRASDGKKRKKEKKSSEASRAAEAARKKESRALERTLQSSAVDFSVKHGDRYVKMSQVADRPQELAKFVVPLGEEVTRHWNILHLRTAFDAAVKEAGVKAPGLLYEMWLLSCNMDASFRATTTKLADFGMDEEKTTKQDVLIPKLELGMAELDKLLEQHNVAAEQRAKVAEAFQSELKNCVKALHVAMMKDASKRVPVELARTATGLTVGRVHLALDAEVRIKLEALYRRFGSSDGEGFDSALAVLLLRYDALKGAAFQSGLPPKVMAVLKKELGVFLEGFASPFNCYFPRYCSLFPDCEFAFGSLGTFFDFRPLDGSFSAFPPPVPSVAVATVHHIEDVLMSSKRALSFLLVLHGKLYDAWPPLQAALTSTYFVQRHCFAARQHALTEGFGYRRDQSQLKLAVFETQFILLQNEAGAKRWPLTEAVVESLHQAFRGQVAQPDPASVVAAEAVAQEKPVAPAAPVSSNWKSLKKKLKTGKK